MNKTRRKILKYLYDVNRARSSRFCSLVDIKDHTKIDIRVIESETDYLSQKGYIEKQLIVTSRIDIAAYSCKITAHGIDIIEPQRFMVFSKIIRKFWWFFAVLIPLVLLYLDFLGLKTQVVTFFIGENQALVTKEKYAKPPLANEIRDSENQQQIAKIKITRIIEDANFWLEERVKQNMSEIEKIKNNFASRNVSYGGGHITAHINRVNYFIKSVNIHIKEMDRKIEDILLSIGEDKFETIAWLNGEYKKYAGFLEGAKAAKDSIKQQNEGVCLKYAERPTFENILKAHPYIE